MTESVAPVLAQAAATVSRSASPRLDAEVLLAHVSGHPRSWLAAHPESIVDQADLTRFRALLARRQRGEPIAYLTERKEFYGREFVVSAAVLVPRPESEQLVELALAELESGDHLYDVGTGSGCLAITLKLARPELTVTASDVSPEALSVTKQNMEKHQATLSLIETDLCPPLADPRHSVVVANLPYVPHPAAARGELAHEPALALDGGPDGFDVIARLLDQLEEAWPRVLLLEIDPPQATRLRQRYGTTCHIVPDLAGRDRFAVIKP